MNLSPSDYERFVRILEMVNPRVQASFAADPFMPRLPARDGKPLPDLRKPLSANYCRERLEIARRNQPQPEGAL